LPVNSSGVINQAGPNGSTDLNAHLSYHKPQPSVTQTFTLPYSGNYQVAIRVAGVVGPGCAIAVGFGGPLPYTVNLVPSDTPYSLLLYDAYGTSSPGSVTVEIMFSGSRSASLILEKMWLVPNLVNPYAS
jgi:hypothetical protein